MSILGLCPKILNVARKRFFTSLSHIISEIINEYNFVTDLGLMCQFFGYKPG